VGWIAGCIYGGLLEIGSLGGKLLDQLGSSVSSYLPLVGGVLLLFIVLTAPDGMAAQGYDHLQQLIGRVRRTPRTPKVPDLTRLEAHRVAQRDLVLDDVSVSFGGVKAVRNVSLTVRAGEIVGLIGPNGAGKTTLIDAATGFVQRGIRGADDEESVVEMGGSGTSSEESRVSEAAVRGFWKAYRRHMDM